MAFGFSSRITQSVSRLSTVTSRLREEIIPSANLNAELLLSPKQQFAALMTARAAVFSSVGSYENAVGLREAAVLLDPNAADQRLLLVKEYERIIKRALAKHGHDPKPAVQAAITRHGETWRIALGHLEYLIRNRQISLDEAADSGWSCTTMCRGHRRLPSAWPSWTPWQAPGNG